MKNHLALLAFAALSITAIATPSFAEITGNTVVDARMRAGPSTSHSVVSGVRAYDLIGDVTQTGQYLDGHQWLHVTYNGRSGYIWGAMICTSKYVPGSQQCNNRQVQPVAQQPVQQSYEYTKHYSCGHDGTPMTVRFREENDNSVAYVRHDMGYEVRLVKPWGSNGDQYFTDNTESSGIYGRGSQMTYQMDGLRQNCRETPIK